MGNDIWGIMKECMAEVGCRIRSVRGENMQELRSWGMK